MKIEVEANQAKVERELEGDARELVTLPLPALLTIQTGAGESAPRYPNIKGIMAASCLV